MSTPPCPICVFDGGFHGPECTGYHVVTKETRPPGTEAFKAWLRGRA